MKKRIELDDREELVTCKPVTCNSPKVTIIEYGAGNLFSVKAAVERLGGEVVCSADPEMIRGADKVIFPGVGQAAAAMRQLRRYGLDRVIPELEVPVLGICLGMQLMCAYSEEGATEGLGIFPMRVNEFEKSSKVPHMGWNGVYDLKSGLLEGVNEGERVYFVHSYYVPVNEYTVASCDYQVVFSAAIRKGNFWGCQFHPEKSAGVGERIIENFLKM